MYSSPVGPFTPLTLLCAQAPHSPVRGSPMVPNNAASNKEN
jgi:hypothetical protein